MLHCFFVLVFSCNVIVLFHIKCDIRDTLLRRPTFDAKSRQKRWGSSASGGRGSIVFRGSNNGKSSPQTP